jgi:hypothetical protein
MKYNTRLVRCIRCPTTYHVGDYCIAAGTIDKWVVNTFQIQPFRKGLAMPADVMSML